MSDNSNPDPKPDFANDTGEGGDVDSAARGAQRAAQEGGAGPELLAARVAEFEAQIKDLTDRLLRAHAEMDNMRKRAERDKIDMAKYAITKFARDIVGVGDNFQRAIAAVPAGAAERDPALKSLLEGVEMTERELLNVLERHGVKRIDPKGDPFNPHFHQAMMEQHNAEVPAGTVVQVYQPGYSIEDRVLRPAMVVVAKGGPKPAKVDTDDSSEISGNDNAPGPSV
jgi:molecular chaperone GrpE